MRITPLMFVAGLLAFGWGAVASAGIAVSFPIESDFDNGLDGWTIPLSMERERRGNTKNDFILAGMNRIKGNPGGFIFAPDEYLGDWSDIDGNGTLSFQYRRFDNGDAVVKTKPLLVFIEGGEGSRAYWKGPNIKKKGNWRTFTIPIEEGSFTMQEGTWEDLVSNVTELRFAVERVVNRRGRDERSGIDNIVLNATQPAPVPEPAAIALLALAAPAILARRRRK